MRKKALVFLSLVLFGCQQGASSLAESALAYLVAKHAERIEIETRQYTRINRCFIKDKPNAFLLAEDIMYGSPVTGEYQIMFAPEGQKSDPVAPHELAYAMYVIAAQLGDTRAPAKKEWLASYMDAYEAKNIEKYIEYKYLQSYLEKCFSASSLYQKRLTPREIVKEDYVRDVRE